MSFIKTAYDREFATVAVKKIVAEFDRTPEEINRGLCEKFAERLAAVLGEGASVSEVDGDEILGHVWVNYRGRCYDAECPQGVPAYRELPFFRRQ